MSLHLVSSMPCAHRTRWWRGLVGAALVACWVPESGVAGEVAAEPAFGPVVVLSPYEVTAASAEFEHWIKVGSPNFIIYTDARTKDALTILQQLEMLHFTTQAFFGRRANVRTPAVFVLPTARSDWRKLQSKGGLVEWKAGMSGSRGRVVELIVAQYDWQEEGLYLVWSVAATAEIERLNIETAFWFNYGIGSFFETALFSKDSLKIGQVSQRASWVQGEGFLEWPRFFAVDAKSPEFIKDNTTMRRYFGQCAAFVQFMLANPDPIWMPRLLVWNAALEAGREPTEELFKGVFDQDWAEWDKTMRAYMGGGRFNILNVPFPESVRDVPRSQLGLTTTEMRELFVLAQIVNQNVPESDVALDSLLTRGLKTEGLRELLAEACLARRHRDGAREQLQALIDAGSKNPAVYTRAAQQLLGLHVHDTSVRPRIDAETKAQVQAWCREALALEPLIMDANDALAWANAFGPTVGEEELAEIGQICRRLVGNGATDWSIAALAVARWRAGRSESARKACQVLLDSPFSEEETRENAREVLAELAAGH